MRELTQTFVNPCENLTLLVLYIRISWCYMYSTIEIYVNSKTLPSLSRTTGSRPSQEKSGAYSHSSSRNRSGGDLRAESQRYLGSTPKRRSGGELPHVLHGCMARKEKANRGQQPGKTGQTLWRSSSGKKNEWKHSKSATRWQT